MSITFTLEQIDIVRNTAIVVGGFVGVLAYAKWAAYSIEQNTKLMTERAILNDRIEMIRSRLRAAGHDETTVNREIARRVNRERASNDAY
jgi:hypothetical protein